MTPGSLVLVVAGGGKTRIAVVLEVHPSVAVVAWVTGTHRPSHPHVEVDQNSQAGKALRLDKPRYFYPDHIETRALSDLQRRDGRASPQLRMHIAGLIGSAPATQCGTCRRST